MYGRPPVDRLARRLKKDGQARILFLSNHGSARALIAESIVNRHSASGFTAASAGVIPEGEPHPMAEELLRAYRLPHTGAPPIALDEAMERAENEFDYVVALWDRSCGEPFPAAHRKALAASWNVADPRRPFEAGAGIVGSRMGFVRAYTSLRQRISHFFADVSAERAAVDLTRDRRNAEAPPPVRRLPDREPTPVRVEAPEPPARRSIWSLGSILKPSRPTSDVYTLQSEPLDLGKSMLHKPSRRSPSDRV